MVLGRAVVAAALLDCCDLAFPVWARSVRVHVVEYFLLRVEDGEQTLYKAGPGLGIISLFAKGCAAVESHTDACTVLLLRPDPRIVLQLLEGRHGEVPSISVLCFIFGSLLKTVSILNILSSVLRIALISGGRLLHRRAAGGRL